MLIEETHEKYLYVEDLREILARLPSMYVVLTNTTTNNLSILDENFNFIGWIDFLDGGLNYGNV